MERTSFKATCRAAWWTNQYDPDTGALTNIRFGDGYYQTNYSPEWRQIRRLMGRQLTRRGVVGVMVTLANQAPV